MLLAISTESFKTASTVRVRLITLIKTMFNAAQLFSYNFLFYDLFHAMIQYRTTNNDVVNKHTQITVWAQSSSARE